MKKNLFILFIFCGAPSMGHAENQNGPFQDQALCLPVLASEAAGSRRLIERAAFLSSLAKPVVQSARNASGWFWTQPLPKILESLSTFSWAWAAWGPHAGPWVLAGLIPPSYDQMLEDKRLLHHFTTSNRKTLRAEFEGITLSGKDRKLFLNLKSVVSDPDSFDALVDAAGNLEEGAPEDPESAINRLRQALKKITFLSLEQAKAAESESNSKAKIQRWSKKTLGRWAALHRAQAGTLFSHSVVASHAGASRVALQIGSRSYALVYRMEDDQVVRIVSGVSWINREELSVLDILLVELLYQRGQLLSQRLEMTLIVDKPPVPRPALIWMEHLKTFHFVRHLDKNSASKSFRASLRSSWFPVALDFLNEKTKPKEDDAAALEYFKVVNPTDFSPKKKRGKRLDASELRHIPMAWNAIQRLAEELYSIRPTPTIIAEWVLLFHPRPSVKKIMDEWLTTASAANPLTPDATEVLARIFKSWKRDPTLLRGVIKRWGHIYPHVQHRLPTSQDLIIQAA